MTKHSGGATINQGGASQPTNEEKAREFDVTGNVAEKGEEPSPGARERGETTSADSAGPVDLEGAHQRAS